MTNVITGPFALIIFRCAFLYRLLCSLYAAADSRIRCLLGQYYDDDDDDDHDDNNNINNSSNIILRCICRKIA